MQDFLHRNVPDFETLLSFTPEMIKENLSQADSCADVSVDPPEHFICLENDY